MSIQLSPLNEQQLGAFKQPDRWCESVSNCSGLMATFKGC